MRNFKSSVFLKSIDRSIRRFLAMEERFLIVVSGCTGTGKSDLGIEIAKAFNGEIISSDSMQIYKGLDVATNKVTKNEMQGIPHHMMSFYDPSESDYNVHTFRAEALNIMDGIWNCGKLPIIVGGTSYYVESLMYDNYLIPSNTSKKDELRARLESENPSDDELYELLKSVDPDSAAQVHRHNRTRVLRALEIYYSTGVRKSQHLANQRLSNVFEFGGKLRFKNTLLLNLDAEKEILDSRLDKRVETMIAKNLREEVENFYDKYGASIGTHGITQAIGLKEFLPYLALTAEERGTPRGEKLFTAGCELLKVHTRQYCRKQRNWLYNRILLRSESRQVPEYVSLNTSRDFYEKVVPIALDVVRNFTALRDPLKGLDRPENVSVLMPLPENAEKVSKALAARDYHHNANLIHYCEFCNIEIQSEKSWIAHIEGRKHRTTKAALKRKLTTEPEPNSRQLTVSDGKPDIT